MFADLIALIRRPVAALNTIDLDRRVTQGGLALAVSIVLPAAVSELGALGPFRPPAELGSLPSLTAQGADLYARWSYQHRFLIPLYGVLITLALWVGAAALIHGVARALKGRGSFSGFFKLAGYVALVGVALIPFALIDALARLSGNGRVEASAGELLGFLSVAVLVWQNVLLVFAARQHYKLSTEKALAAVVGPIGAAVVLGLALLILAAILFVLSQGS